MDNKIKEGENNQVILVYGIREAFAIMPVDKWIDYVLELIRICMRGESSGVFSTGMVSNAGNTKRVFASLRDYLSQIKVIPLHPDTAQALVVSLELDSDMVFGDFPFFDVEELRQKFDQLQAE